MFELCAFWMATATMLCGNVIHITSPCATKISWSHSCHLSFTSHVQSECTELKATVPQRFGRLPSSCCCSERPDTRILHLELNTLAKNERSESQGWLLNSSSVLIGCSFHETCFISWSVMTKHPTWNLKLVHKKLWKIEILGISFPDHKPWIWHLIGKFCWPTGSVIKTHNEDWGGKTRESDHQTGSKRELKLEWKTHPSYIQSSPRPITRQTDNNPSPLQSTVFKTLPAPKHHTFCQNEQQTETIWLEIVFFTMH